MSTEREVAVLPQGVSKADFLAAIARFEQIVGPENVLTAEGRLTPYTKIMMAVDNAPNTRHPPQCSRPLSSRCRAS